MVINLIGCTYLEYCQVNNIWTLSRFRQGEEEITVIPKSLALAMIRTESKVIIS